MSLSPTQGAGVSVIIPSYESQATVRATLESLRQQTFRDFETILIDSGRSDEVARIAGEFPEVRYHRSEQRLLPHAARNLGIKLVRSDVLVFTDPDVVSAPDWLEQLIANYRRLAMPVAGAVASWQSDWLETGIHLTKFDLWLPGGKPRTVPVAASVNFLCSRQHLERAGGFDGREMIGDTLLSWDLIRLGQTLQFAPDAIVYHDHRSSFAGLLRERFVRGADFARLRAARENWKASRTLAILAASILPLRLIKLLARAFTCSWRGGCVLDWLKTIPVIAAGHAAWLAGESVEYCRRLQIFRARHEAKRQCAS
jgi:glycosyltransferase involved in cell wall biosynthesis